MAHARRARAINRAGKKSITCSKDLENEGGEMFVISLAGDDFNSNKVLNLVGRTLKYGLLN